MQQSICKILQLIIAEKSTWNKLTWPLRVGWRLYTPNFAWQTYGRVKIGASSSRPWEYQQDTANPITTTSNSYKLRYKLQVTSYGITNKIMPGDRRRGRCQKRGTFRDLSGPALTVISVNIEGFWSAKQNILADLCSKQQCDVLCLHRGSENNRPTIPGMVLAIERPHRQYGSAVFVYKPPPVHFMSPQPASQVHSKPQIIIGDFNSHSTQWGYSEINKDGEAVEDVDGY